MTKSRDQRCRSVIRNFFELPTNLDKTYYEFSKKIESGWKTARYQINIPNKWESRAPHYNTDTHNLEWNTIEHVQELLTKEKMEELTLDLDIIKTEMEGDELQPSSGETGSGVTNFELKQLQAQNEKLRDKR